MFFQITEAVSQICTHSAREDEDGVDGNWVEGCEEKGSCISIFMYRNGHFPFETQDLFELGSS